MTLPTGWSVEVPEGFGQVDNGDSWQAISPDATRIVYIASLDVRGPRENPTADQIIESAFKDKAGAIDHREGPLVGRAKVSSRDGAWVVNAISAVPTRLATTTISIRNNDDVPWALDVWRSIRFEGEPPKEKRRLWPAKR